MSFDNIPQHLALSLDAILKNRRSLRTSTLAGEFCDYEDDGLPDFPETESRADPRWGGLTFRRAPDIGCAPISLWPELIAKLGFVRRDGDRQRFSNWDGPRPAEEAGAVSAQDSAEAASARLQAEVRCLDVGAAKPRGAELVKLYTDGWEGWQRANKAQGLVTCGADLAGVLNGDSMVDRRRAIRAAKKSGSPQMIEYLEPLLQDGSRIIRAEVEQAILHLRAAAAQTWLPFDQS
jgi:hypothetical protein